MHGFSIRPVGHDLRHQSAREVQAAAPARDKEVAGAALIVATARALTLADGVNTPSLAADVFSRKTGGPRALVALAPGYSFFPTLRLLRPPVVESDHDVAKAISWLREIGTSSAHQDFEQARSCLSLSQPRPDRRSCSSPSSITRRSSSMDSRDFAALVLDVVWSGSSNWRRSSRIFSRACRFFERT